MMVGNPNPYINFETIVTSSPTGICDIVPELILPSSIVPPYNVIFHLIYNQKIKRVIYPKLWSKNHNVDYISQNYYKY